MVWVHGCRWQCSARRLGANLPTMEQPWDVGISLGILPFTRGGIAPSFNSPLEVNPIHGTFALEQLQVHGRPALAKAADLAVCLQNG